MTLNKPHSSDCATFSGGCCDCLMQHFKVHESTEYTSEEDGSTHSSDCNFWVDEPCNCMMRHDPDELLDRLRDSQEVDS